MFRGELTAGSQEVRSVDKLIKGVWLERSKDRDPATPSDILM